MDISRRWAVWCWLLATGQESAQIGRQEASAHKSLEPRTQEQSPRPSRQVPGKPEDGAAGDEVGGNLAVSLSQEQSPGAN